MGIGLSNTSVSNFVQNCKQLLAMMILIANGAGPGSLDNRLADQGKIAHP
jgi:hypothetical protein